MATAEATADRASSASQKLTLLRHRPVMGSMIGGGVFNLPSECREGRRQERSSIGWVITGRRHADARVRAIKVSPCGSRNSMPGPMPTPKRVSAILLALTVRGLLAKRLPRQRRVRRRESSALSYFFPVFGDGNNLPSILGASVCLWLIHALVLKGIKQAAFVNE